MGIYNQQESVCKLHLIEDGMGEGILVLYLKGKINIKNS